MAKTGDDVNSLERDFVKLKQKFKSSSLTDEATEATDDNTKPLSALRLIVPATNPPASPEDLRPDPDLDLQTEAREEWNRYYREAESVMRSFNAHLKQAIEADKAIRGT